MRKLTSPFAGQVVYIAGKLSGDVVTNIETAKHHARLVAAKGHCPLVPHVNFNFWDAETDWRAGMGLCAAIMHRCDSMLLMPGWEQSIGATLEYYIAHALEMTVYYDINDIPTA